MSVALTGINPTLLYIAPISGRDNMSLPPYGARSLTQTLNPINGPGGGGGSSGLLRRSLRGRMIDLTSPIFHVYRSTVSYRDGTPPALDDSWIGEIVQVDCAIELAYVTGGSPKRTVVSGSTRVEGWLTYYRPSLIMMVSGIQQSFSEYEGLYNVTVDFEELEPPA